MTILSSLIQVMKTSASIFVPGVKSFEDAGEAVLDLIQSVRPTLSSTDQAALDAALPDLLAKMNRSVDQALKDLRGE